MVSPPNRTFCPVHGFWATNRGRLTPGGPLFPNTSANNFNQRLKRDMRDLNYEDGHRYPSHAFRGGGEGDPKFRIYLPDHSEIRNMGLWGLQMLP